MTYEQWEYVEALEGERDALKEENRWLRAAIAAACKDAGRALYEQASKHYKDAQPWESLPETTRIWWDVEAKVKEVKPCIRR